MNKNISKENKIMKRAIIAVASVAVVGAVFLAVNSGTALANAGRVAVQALRGGITVQLHGNTMNLATEDQPVVIDGRTFLPVRAIADGLGLDVQWDPATQTVIIGEGSGVPTTPPTQTPPAAQAARSLIDVGSWASGSNWTTVQGASNPHGDGAAFRVRPPGRGAGLNSRIFNMEAPATVLEFTMLSDRADTDEGRAARLVIENADTGVELFNQVMTVGESGRFVVELFGAQRLRFRAGNEQSGTGNYIFVLNPTVR